MVVKKILPQSKSPTHKPKTLQWISLAIRTWRWSWREQIRSGSKSGTALFKYYRGNNPGCKSLLHSHKLFKFRHNDTPLFSSRVTSWQRPRSIAELLPTPQHDSCGHRNTENYKIKFTVFSSFCSTNKIVLISGFFFFKLCHTICLRKSFLFGNAKKMCSNLLKVNLTKCLFESIYWTSSCK